MSEYTPDKWVVIEIDYEGVKTLKILASWYGGWGGDVGTRPGSWGNSSGWRLSSGITEVEELEDSYIFKNESGSVYTCFKNRYGMSSYTGSVLKDFKKQAVITMVEKYEKKD
jgi:hypothetical protein